MDSRFRFGHVELLSVERRLLVSGVEAPIGSRAFDILLVLIGERQRVVTKDELLDRVWPGLVVEEANVQVQVSALRKLIGRDVIATIPGIGYRFAATLIGAEPSSPPLSTVAIDSPELGNLVGRRTDIERVVGLFARHRLISIVGAGGVGKTRLARAVASQLVECHTDGIRWADLGAVTSSNHVLAAVVRAVGIDLGEVDDYAQLARRLAQRSLLLVLDNCEHLSAEVARLVAALLRGSPHLYVLVTSQDPLHLQGEEVYRLSALAVPREGSSLEEARGTGALQLLDMRVRSIDRGFVLDGTNIDAAAHLCRSLDGNALAIEMAAARVALLGVDGVVARLGERLRLLSATQRDLPIRQQSLRAMLEWSHGLLTEVEQTVLRRLSVFVSIFNLETATRVVADRSIDEWTFIEALATLVDRSLVQVASFKPPRYRLLDSVRVFASDRLSAAGEELSIQTRHGEAYGMLADEALADVWIMTDGDWLRHHGDNQPDLEAAFERACRRSDAAVGAALAALLCRLDGVHSQTSSARRRKEAAWELLPHGDNLARARLWSCLSDLGALKIGAVTRGEAAERALAAWRNVGDQREIYLALWRVAIDCTMDGDAAGAHRASEEAESLECREWPARLRWSGANSRNDVASNLGEYAGYRQRCLAALALAQEAGDARRVARTRLNLADQALLAGDVDYAIETGRQVVAELCELDQPAALGWALSNLCAAYLVARDSASAIDAARRALPLMWDNGWGVDLLNHVALIATQQGRHRIAARLLGYADAEYAANGDRALVNEARLAEVAKANTVEVLGVAEVEQNRALGAHMSQDKAWVLAQSVLE